MIKPFISHTDENEILIEWITTNKRITFFIDLKNGELDMFRTSRVLFGEEINPLDRDAVRSAFEWLEDNSESQDLKQSEQVEDAPSPITEEVLKRLEECGEKWPDLPELDGESD